MCTAHSLTVCSSIWWGWGGGVSRTPWTHTPLGYACFVDFCVNSWHLYCFSHSITMEVWKLVQWKTAKIHWNDHTLDADPLHADPSVDRMTHDCKNITLPQASFAGANNWKRCSGDAHLCSARAHLYNIVTLHTNFYLPALRGPFAHTYEKLVSWICPPLATSRFAEMSAATSLFYIKDKETGIDSVQFTIKVISVVLNYWSTNHCWTELECSFEWNKHRCTHVHWRIYSSRYLDTLLYKFELNMHWKCCSLYTLTTIEEKGWDCSQMYNWHNVVNRITMSENLSTYEN